MDLVIERLEGQIFSSSLLQVGDAADQPDQFPHEYDHKQIVAVAMACAASPIVAKKMSTAFKHAKFFKVAQSQKKTCSRNDTARVTTKRWSRRG